jgi:hypothetical protein
MDHSNGQRVPDDLMKVAEALREARPTATPLELDRIKLEAKHRAARARPSFYSRQKGNLMKSRLALALVLVLGVLMSGTGGALAVDGVSALSGVEEPTDEGPTLQGTQDDPASGDPASGDPASGDPQETAQVEAAGDENLPFTGFLAIPMLIGGVGLLSTGVVLRRKAKD